MTFQRGSKNRLYRQLDITTDYFSVILDNSRALWVMKMITTILEKSFLKIFVSRRRPTFKIWRKIQMINNVWKPFLCIPVNDIKIISIGKIECFMLNFVYKNDRFAIFKSLEIMSHHNVCCLWPDRRTHFHNKGRFFARFPERRA